MSSNDYFIGRLTVPGLPEGPYYTEPPDLTRAYDKQVPYQPLIMSSPGVVSSPITEYVLLNCTRQTGTRSKPPRPFAHVGDYTVFDAACRSASALHRASRLHTGRDWATRGPCTFRAHIGRAKPPCLKDYSIQCGPLRIISNGMPILCSAVQL
jgi:hypothetical protein